MSESGSVNSAGTKSDQAALGEKKKQLSRLRVLIYQKGQARMTVGASATDASKQAWLHAMKPKTGQKTVPDWQKALGSFTNARYVQLHCPCEPLSSFGVVRS